VATSPFSIGFAGGFEGLGPGSVVYATGHGLAIGDQFYFANVLPTDSGINEGTPYYVLTLDYGANSFLFSALAEGTAFMLSHDITAGDLIGADTYEPVTDPTAIMAPPTTRDVTHSWDEPPGQPQNVTVAGGFKAIACHWTATAVPDLMFYDFRYALDDASAPPGAPDTTTWVNIHTRSTTVWVDDLVIDQKYWTQVRAVDYTGNVVTSDVDATAVNYLADGEAGWTTAQSVTPSKVPETDIAFNSVLTNIVSANALDASTITTGLLSISTTDATAADGLRIYDTGVLVGFWDETGLYVSDAGGFAVADGAIGDLTAANYIRVFDGGLTVHADGETAIDVLDVTGLNAGAVTRGALRGGPNLLKNGSFEMTDWVAAPTARVYTATADLNGGTGTQGTTVSSTNVTVSNAFTATAGTGTY